jgi:hypothetical protein
MPHDGKFSLTNTSSPPQLILSSLKPSTHSNNSFPSSLAFLPLSPVLLLLSTHCPSTRRPLRPRSLHRHCPRRPLPHPYTLHREQSICTSGLPLHPIPINCTDPSALLSIHLRGPRPCWYHSSLLQVSNPSNTHCASY